MTGGGEVGAMLIVAAVCDVARNYTTDRIEKRQQRRAEEEKQIPKGNAKKEEDGLSNWELAVEARGVASMVQRFGNEYLQMNGQEERAAAAKVKRLINVADEVEKAADLASSGGSSASSGGSCLNGSVGLAAMQRKIVGVGKELVEVLQKELDDLELEFGRPDAEVPDTVEKGVRGLQLYLFLKRRNVQVREVMLALELTNERAELAELSRGLEELNAPSTFTQYAKRQRERLKVADKVTRLAAEASKLDLSSRQSSKRGSKLQSIADRLDAIMLNKTSRNVLIFGIFHGIKNVLSFALLWLLIPTFSSKNVAQFPAGFFGWLSPYAALICKTVPLANAADEEAMTDLGAAATTFALSFTMALTLCNAASSAMIALASDLFGQLTRLKKKGNVLRSLTGSEAATGWGAAGLAVATSEVEMPKAAAAPVERAAEENPLAKKND